MESIPRQTLASQRGWAENFVTVVNAAPATYGLSGAQAFNFLTLYNAFNLAFNQAGVIDRVAVDPAGYTQPNRAALYAAANAAMDTMSGAAVAIQADTTISDAAKLAAGITPRNFSRTPQTLPAEAPVLSMGPVVATDAVIRALNLVGTAQWPVGATSIQFEVGLADISTGSPVFGAYQSVAAVRSRNYYYMSISGSAPSFRVRARYIGRRSQFGPWTAPLTLVNPNFGN